MSRNVLFGVGIIVPNKKSFRGVAASDRFCVNFIEIFINFILGETYSAGLCQVPSEEEYYQQERYFNIH